MTTEPITADTASRAAPLVEMNDISIAFGGIKAVDHASIDLYPGEVVGLLGHNGAGKSTLIKVLSGAYKRDSGAIRIDGRDADISNPRDAKAFGIEALAARHEFSYANDAPLVTPKQDDAAGG